MHAARAVDRCTLVDGFVDVAEPGGEIQEVDTAVQPGGEDRYTVECRGRIVQPVDVEAEKLVHDADRRVQHDLEVSSASSSTFLALMIARISLYVRT